MVLPGLTSAAIPLGKKKFGGAALVHARADPHKTATQCVLCMSSLADSLHFVFVDDAQIAKSSPAASACPLPILEPRRAPS